MLADCLFVDLFKGLSEHFTPLIDRLLRWHDVVRTRQLYDLLKANHVDISDWKFFALEQLHQFQEVVRLGATHVD